MADITLVAAPVLGTDIQIGENLIVERDDLAIVSVATPLGRETDMVSALKTSWALDLPTPTLSTFAEKTRAIRTAPDQVFLLFPHTGHSANEDVQAKLGGAGYTTDQTDAWVILEVSGPDTLAALERICPLDLDLAAFPSGASARTVMEHMGAMLVRLDKDRFQLLSARSSAASFLHAVQQSYSNVTM